MQLYEESKELHFLWILTSWFAGVLSRHQIGVNLTRLGGETRGVKGPRLTSKRHTQVPVCIHFQNLPNLTQRLRINTHKWRVIETLTNRGLDNSVFTKPLR